MRLCKFLDSVNAGSLPVNAWAPVRLILEVDTGVDLFLLGAEAAGSNRIDFLTLVTDGMDMDCSMNFEVENPNKTPIPSVVFGRPSCKQAKSVIPAHLGNKSEESMTTRKRLPLRLC